MTPDGGHDGTQGWGEYLHYYRFQSGLPEIAHTHTTYLRIEFSLFLDLGAKIIISPSTLVNPYRDATYDKFHSEENIRAVENFKLVLWRRQRQLTLANGASHQVTHYNLESRVVEKSPSGSDVKPAIFTLLAADGQSQLVGVLAAGAADELRVAATLDDLAADAAAVGGAVDEVGLMLADEAAALAALDDVENEVAHDERRPGSWTEVVLM
ncbi:uncharacterized protein GLRG_07674 [Colletotrichum graminicola M1.001]|uniref:Uncharacterized protein n=1 Tax=Colletotrichum graminicola (strain M1.001 / M2 / FGSC 10212) TaxID=645133 RepID=E3QNP7_COLGM|nr:uncharacterized protein GLRG_07674 [Colletotrichum graminicola M1.001]EFQ32404.1 hypothetical protein GLRG_07674 [Colletotrichum graminicola M1.001]